MLLEEVQSLGLPFSSTEFEKLPAALLSEFVRSIQHMPTPPNFQQPQYEHDISFLQRVLVLSLPNDSQNEVVRAGILICPLIS